MLLIMLLQSFDDSCYSEMCKLRTREGAGYPSPGGERQDVLYFYFQRPVSLQLWARKEFATTWDACNYWFWLKARKKSCFVGIKKKTLRPENRLNLFFLWLTNIHSFKSIWQRKERILESFSLFPKVGGINSSQPLTHFPEPKKKQLAL